MDINNFNTTPQSKQTIDALWRLEKIILDSLDFKEVVQKIVDSVLVELGYLKLGYRIVVLALIDKKVGQLKRVSISQTEEAKKALAITPVPFQEINIPLSASGNFCIKAVLENKPYVTRDWRNILVPPYTEDEAISVQGVVGIKTTMVYPVTYHGEGQGIIIFSMVKEESEVSEAEKDLIKGFTDVVGLAVQNSRLYTALEDTTAKLTLANDRLHELDILKSEFVSVASHELRTPMTAIKSYLWMAIVGRGGLVTDKQKYYLERAYISTDRLIKLVNDLLNVSRIESGKLSLEVAKLELGQFIDEVISEVKPRADEVGVSIVNEFDPQKPMPAVIGDSDKLKEVVINLIGNSLKFTGQGGKIRIWFELKDDMITTHVTDDGEGISPEDLPKLFQKFGLVKESYVTNQKASQGTGLGLYISKSIIELHHGKMWAESEGRGKGATFSFTLPVYSDQLLGDFKAQYGSKEGLGIIHSTID